MNLTRLRKLKTRSRWVQGIFSANPVLIGGLGLPFAVMTTNNLKSAVSMSVLLACSMIPTVLLTYLVGKYISPLVRTIVYTTFSMVLIIVSIPLILPISPEVVDSLGIYIPLLALNSIMLTLCERCSDTPKRFLVMLVDAICYCVGFMLAMTTIALYRELAGNGTVWGVPMGLPFKIGGMQATFAGFIVVGFASALLRFLRRGLLWLFFLYTRATDYSG